MFLFFRLNLVRGKTENVRAKITFLNRIKKFDNVIRCVNTKSGREGNLITGGENGGKETIFRAYYRQGGVSAASSQESIQEEETTEKG